MIQIKVSKRQVIAIGLCIGQERDACWKRKGRAPLSWVLNEGVEKPSGFANMRSFDGTLGWLRGVAFILCDRSRPFDHRISNGWCERGSV
jgi:hypothetical protein